MENKPPVKEKYIESPERLWELFEEYVLYECNNPMYKVDYVGKDGKEVNTALQTPITFEGFECYLADMDIIQDLGDYASNKDGKYTAYSTIITRVRKKCFVQNFKGASVGLFNPNLIARKLGLTEKIQEDGTKEVIVKVKYDRKGIGDNISGATPGAIEGISGSEEV